MHTMKSFLVSFAVLLAVLSQAPSIYGSTSLTVQGISDSSESASVNIDEYQLPYPGMLPDNPLYPLKTFRDKIVGFLISDPLKKAEFNVLQADKRLQAGVYLIDKSKKYKLAIETISKGVNYLEEAFLKTSDAYKQGMDAAAMQDRLEKALAKHESVISALSKKAPEDFSAGFEILSSRIDKYKEQVSRLKPQN